jgi:tetratricopeptide (TPR) repeat protein
VFGLSFFLVTIILSQTVLLIDNFQANRYAYLPYLGLLLIIGHFVDRLLNSKATRRRWPQIQTAATAVLLAVAIVLASLTFVRSRVWHDTISVMSNSIENEPGVPFVYNSRGIARYKAGDYAGAQADFEKTIALDPQFYLSYYYLGILKYLAGDYKGALADHEVVVSHYPSFAAGYNERGKTKQKLNDQDGALWDFSQAVALDSYLPEAYYNRGVVELDQGDNRAAFSDFDRAIELFADYADAYDRRGVARVRLGDPAAACDDWAKAQELGSSEAAKSYADSCPAR